MIKNSITDLFDNYQSNKITHIPLIQYRPTRNIFHYLIPQTIHYHDLRTSLKPKPTPTNSSQSILQTLQRYLHQFQLRNSAQQRVLTHTQEFTAFYALLIFGFYSRHLAGWKRSFFVLKETSKTALYCGSLYGINQVLYPFTYKLTEQINKKHMFTPGNILSALFVWPLIALIEWNILVSLRKTMFICAYGQIRDIMTEFQRFYKLHPDHFSSRIKTQSQRIKHPSEDITKRLQSNGRSRASMERKAQQKEGMERKLLAQNDGQKIPSTNMYMMMPQIYRSPTKEEQLEHERKASKKTQQILDKRGITWITAESSEERQKRNKSEQKSQQKGVETSGKKSWFSWS